MFDRHQVNAVVVLFFAGIFMSVANTSTAANGNQSSDDDLLLMIVPAIAAAGKNGSSSDVTIDDSINFGTIIRSSSLGWQAGEDISSKLSALVNNSNFKPNTTLLLEANFQVQASVRLRPPKDFVLAGARYGNGLTFRNTEQGMNNPWLILEDNSALYNVSIIHKETRTSSQKSNVRSIKAAADNIKIVNSYFEGNVGIYVDVAGDNFLVSDSHFNRGYYQLRLSNSQDAVFHNTLFENGLGDGIKTIRPGSGELGVERPRVLGCVFMNNDRDGIDTTGGFRNSLIKDSYFVNLFKGMDIKSGYDQNTRVFQNQSLQSLNANIQVENSEFINNNNGIAAITLDRGPSGNGNNRWITNANARDWLTQRINVKNSTFENIGSGRPNAMLLQDVHSVSWDGVSLYGSINLNKIGRNPVPSGQVDPSVTTNFNISGKNVVKKANRPAKPDSYYRNLAGVDKSTRFRR